MHNWRLQMTQQQKLTAPVVEVTEIRAVNKGSLRAFATVRLSNTVIIHSVRMIQQLGQAAWVSMPQNEVKSTTGGKSKYFSIVEIVDEDLKVAITAAVLKAYNAAEKCVTREPSEEPFSS